MGRHILVTPLPAGAPTEFRVFNFGTTDTTKGSYEFDTEAADAVMAAFNDSGNRLTIDYEHQALQDPPIPAPAAASFIPQIRPDGLYATDVKWTQKAGEMLNNKEYLYFSPAFHTDDSGKPSRLLNVALTNIPATKHMQPLVVASQLIQEPRMKTVLNALNLKESASEAEALSALTVLRQEGDEILKLTGTKSLGQALGPIVSWKASAAEVEQLKAAIAKRDAAEVERDFVSTLEQATKDGKIPPAESHPLRAFAMSLRGKPDGLVTLKAFVAAQPAIVPVGGTAPSEPNPSNGGATVTLSEDEKHIARQMGIKPKELLATKIRRLKQAANPGVEIDDDDNVSA